MDDIDLYADFRPPAYNSALGGDNKGVMGRFDPLNGILLLHEGITDALEKGDKPEYDLVEAGKPELLAFTTYLHEIVHWWQHIGTTSGLFYGLSIAVQANATNYYLHKVGASIAKPLVHNLTPEMGENHPAVLAVERWLEIEYGATFLLDHRLLIAKSRHFKYFESPGYSLLMLYANTIATLNALFDPGGTSLPSLDHFLGHYERALPGRAPDFVPNEIIAPVLSTAEIFEGQARICELQYRSLTYRPLTWQELTEIGYLKGDYGSAFETFLTLTRFPEPIHVQDPAVNLFLLLCDIALNPGDGYANEIPHDSLFVRNVHPGHRFIELCIIARERPELLNEMEHVSLTNYNQVTEYLCHQAGWDTPVAVWERVLERTEKMSGIEELHSQWMAASLAPENVSLRFYYAQHRNLLETKVQIPHFFCWPGYFLVNVSGDAEEVSSIQEILRLHQPPFLSRSLTEGVTSFIADHFGPEEKAKLVSDYFGTQVLYDLVRQWVSSRGPFKMKYHWKPDLTDVDRDRLKQRFYAVFERSLDSIPLQ